MQTLIDIMKEQLHKQPFPFTASMQTLPLNSLQKQWLEAMEMVMEMEMEAMRHYLEAWFNLSKACISHDPSRPFDLGHECTDLFCEFNKAFLEHYHKRQKLTKDWRERVSEII